MLADDVYEALVNLAEGKSLPPVALRKYAQQKKIGNDIPDKLLNSESKHRKRQGDVTSVHSERIFA